MNGLIPAIAALAQPVLARVLMALGMSVLTVSGMDAAMGQLKGQIVATLSSSGLSAAMQLAGLAGAWVAMGYVFGALSFAVSWLALTKAVRIAGVS